MSESDNDRIRRTLTPSLPIRIGTVLSGAYYAAAITMACFGLVVWAVKQENRINILEHEFALFSVRLDDFNTHGTRALSERVGIVANQVSNLDARMTKDDAALADRVNSTNSRVNDWETTLRKINVIEARQDEVYRRLQLLENRVYGKDK